MPKPKIVAIFIAYNAANTLKKFWQNFPKHYFDEIILVDDASSDDTFKIAKNLKGLKIYQNPTNLGYGGNLKRAISLALDVKADIIVDIHPDGEYKPSAIPKALEKIKQSKADFIIGNRFGKTNQPQKSGMLAWKILPIKLLNFIDRLVLGIKLTDIHQGFRVYTKKLLKSVNYSANSNDYLFSFELIAQSAFLNLKIMEVPVETHYSGNKRGASFTHSLKYSLKTFKVLVQYLLAKLGLKSTIFKSPLG